MKSYFMHEYEDVFEGAECLPGKHRKNIDDKVTPVVHACRKVPFVLRGIRSHGETEFCKEN